MYHITNTIIPNRKWQSVFKPYALFVILIGILILGYTEIWFLDKIFSYQIETKNEALNYKTYVCK